MSQCWYIVNWILRNKLHLNFNRNSNIFIQENALENVVCEMSPICPFWDITALCIFSKTRTLYNTTISISFKYWVRTMVVVMLQTTFRNQFYWLKSAVFFSTFNGNCYFWQFAATVQEFAQYNTARSMSYPINVAKVFFTLFFTPLPNTKTCV